MSIEALARAVSETDDLHAVLEHALDALIGIVRADRASVLLTDEQGVMRFHAWRGLSEGYRRAVDGHSPWPAGAQNPAPLTIGDVPTADLGHLRDTVTAEGIGALAFVPLVFKRELIGKFMLYYDAPHTFTEVELALSGIVARQIALVVARLSGEAALRDVARRRQFLLDATAVLTESLDPDDMIRRLTSLAVPALADRCTIVLSDAEPPLRAEAGVEGVEDPAGWSEVPIRAGAGVIGALSITNHAGRPPVHENDLALARELADRLAAAVEKARLFRRLQESEERLAVTLRSIGDAVVTTDTSGRVRMLNQPAEDLLGWRQDDAVGHAIEEIVALPTGRLPQKLVAPDGTEHEITHNASPIRDSAGEVLGMVVVIRDVTTERRIEAELARASKLESLGVLAGGIGHDFNNVLTAITANLSLAERRLPAEHDAIERVQSATKACERARDLTKQLLTFARGGAPVKAATSIGEVVRDSAAFALQGSQSRADIALPDDLWPVDADPGQIGQVLHNLVLNADQAMPSGGVVRVEVDNAIIECDCALPLTPGAYVRIRVRDQGVGIAPENVARVFDPFFTTRAEGTGLGLATSYAIVHRHGGHLTLESEVGVGSSFILWLPRGWQEPLAARPMAAAQMGSGRVLVMDDDAGVLQLAGDCLRELGYDVTFASDGSEAIARYEAAERDDAPFDAVILDLTVPGGMGGRDAGARLRERWPEARVIVSSGYSNDPVMAGFREHGFVGVLQKPYRLEDIGRVLAAARLAPAA